MTKSLTARLIFFAALWSSAALILTSFVLTSIFRQNAEITFDRRLWDISTSFDAPLVDAVDSDLAEINVPDMLPQFLEPLSGWYWLILQGDKGEERIRFESNSLIGSELDLPHSAKDSIGQEILQITGPSGKMLRVAERVVQINAGSFRIVVTADPKEMRADIQRFNNLTFFALGLLGLGLILAIYLLIRFGLRPLSLMQAQLAAIRSGEADRMTGTLPTELESLAQELNALIQHNETIVEQAKRHTGNLAHALKTPLSVIQNEISANTPVSKSTLRLQAEQMHSHIDHHLKRARMAAQRRIIGTPVDISAVAVKLVSVIEKIYLERHLDFVEEIESELSVRGEMSDFDELLGNLVDNACKWAKSQVRISAWLEVEPSTVNNIVVLAVEDDGSGLSAAERESAKKRGNRLDETVAGSGLGLSIVQDLVDYYRGEFILERSNLGGLRAVIRLPAA